LRKMEPERLKEIPKGSLIAVRWLDASDNRCQLDEHISNPEVRCMDWGIYLGISGAKRPMLLVGKDVVEVHAEWGATRIPLELVEEVVVLLPREDVAEVIREAATLGRRVKLRRYSKGEGLRVGP